MMARLASLTMAALVASCASRPRPFPLRAPMLVDTDMHPVSVKCRPDPSEKEPGRVRCAPKEYISPYAWDYIENILFAPLSRAFSVEVSGEAENATSLDEVADSAWFTNRVGVTPLSPEQRSLGACKPEDLLPADVAAGAWVIDQGKANGATLGFRVDVPGKGLYMLKADDLGAADRASAASVIGAALYNALGFGTTCEQIVLVHKEQFALQPGLTVVTNRGMTRPFDQLALEAVLASSTRVGTATRMQASKWLPGLAIGPFRYVGLRADDPNDIIPHQKRRELRGSRLLAAWLNHWDAREQNTMDMWLATNTKDKRSSPGYVRHYFIDTSDVLGGAPDSEELVPRLGHAGLLSFGGIAIDFLTLGIIARPWDRAHVTPGREKFGMYSAQDFDAEAWQILYPNPAMLEMTERDGAWMARIIARLTPEDMRGIVEMGKFNTPGDTEYILDVLLERQHRLLARYLTRLSPVTDVHTVGTDQLCALDLARASKTLPEARFSYRVTQHDGSENTELTTTTTPDGGVCFRAVRHADTTVPRPVRFDVRNGTGAGTLQIHTFELGARGLFVVGLTRTTP